MTDSGIEPDALPDADTGNRGRFSVLELRAAA
jgi:hypothetical protein